MRKYTNFITKSQRNKQGDNGDNTTTKADNTMSEQGPY